MKNVFNNQKHLMLIALLGLTVTAAAWQTDTKKKNDSTATSQYRAGDTTEPKQPRNNSDEFGMKELDEAMKNLDEQMDKLDLQMKDLNVNISKEVNDALAKIDLDKISKQVSDELKKIDFDKIKVDVNQSLDQAKEQLKNIDMQQLKTQMDELQKKFKSDEFKKQIDEAMNHAKESVQKAKAELQQLKGFTDELEREGLIDKKKGYTIEWKDGGDLYINGKKQPKEISDKYKKYYKKDGQKIQMNQNDNDDE